MRAACIANLSRDNEGAKSRVDNNNDGHATRQRVSVNEMRVIFPESSYARTDYSKVYA